MRVDPIKLLGSCITIDDLNTISFLSTFLSFIYSFKSFILAHTCYIDSNHTGNASPYVSRPSYTVNDYIANDYKYSIIVITFTYNYIHSLLSCSHVMTMSTA